VFVAEIFLLGGCAMFARVLLLLALGGSPESAGASSLQDLLSLCRYVNTKSATNNWKEYRHVSFSAIPAERQQYARDSVKFAIESMNRTETDPEIIPLTPSIWAINVVKLGWDPKVWDDMSKEWIYYTYRLDTAPIAYLENVTGTKYPIMRAEIFTTNAWLAKWYTRFMNLPKTKKEFFDQVGFVPPKEDEKQTLTNVSPDQKRRNDPSMVVISENLDPTRFPRKVARVETSKGLTLYISMAYANDKGKNNCRLHPTNLDCDYNEYAFTLSKRSPLIGFWANNKQGNMEDDLPSRIFAHPSNMVLEVGQSCIRCHQSGLKDLAHADTIDKLNLLGADLSTRKLFDKHRMVANVREDRSNFAEFLKNKVNGLTPAANFRAFESMYELVESQINLQTAALETGRAPELLRERLVNHNIKEIRQLVDGKSTVSRNLWEDGFRVTMQLFEDEENAEIAQVF
jgi:hypothetical protein